MPNVTSDDLDVNDPSAEHSGDSAYERPQRALDDGSFLASTQLMHQPHVK